MHDKKYHNNIQEVKKIILMLEDSAIGSNEAANLYERGIAALIEECKSILYSYEGSFEDLTSRDLI